jgi:hypothetical protein
MRCPEVYRMDPIGWIILLTALAVFWLVIYPWVKRKMGGDGK